MRATIRSVGTAHGDALESLIVPDREVFDVSVRAMIGPAGEVGEESFDFHICTPAALADELKRKGYLLVRRRVVIQAWEPALVRGAISTLVTGIVRDSWQQLAEEINTMGSWEFENYPPASELEH